MLQLAILVATVFITAGYSVLIEREKAEEFMNLRGNVEATSFLLYHGAVSTYLAQHPGTTGNVPYASLSVPLGYIQDPRWTNEITGGIAYVYTTTQPSPVFLSAAYRMSGQYIMLGQRLSNGNLSGPTGVIATSIPPTIPTGSLVFVGG